MCPYGICCDVAVNIEVHISLQISVFIFLDYILRSRIAGSYGSSIRYMRCIYLFRLVFSFSWITYLGVELLDRMVAPF